jgi:hypothetical protein
VQDPERYGVVESIAQGAFHRGKPRLPNALRRDRPVFLRPASVPSPSLKPRRGELKSPILNRRYLERDN